MNKELKGLMEKLSRALGEVIQESEQVRLLLRQIEDAGFDVTLAVMLGVQGQNTEIQQVVYGPDRNAGQKASPRRISAFDKRFLRALRIQLPD